MHRAPRAHNPSQSKRSSVSRVMPGDGPTRDFPHTPSLRHAWEVTQPSAIYIYHEEIVHTTQCIHVRKLYDTTLWGNSRTFGE